MTENANDEDEKLLQIEAKIREPILWGSPPICKIMDLQESHYVEALKLIKHYYFPDDPLWKNDYQDDRESVLAYLDSVETWIKDTTSLIAVSATTGRVVGVIVLRIRSFTEKLDTFDRVIDYEGDFHRKVMHLTNTLIKETNVFARLGCDEYLRIYVLCVHPSYKNKQIEKALLSATIKNAIALKMLAIGGIFTTGESQELAASFDFQLMSEIRYGKWLVNDTVVFDNPGQGNYSVAFMSLQLSESLQEKSYAEDDD
ncbi:uncharacterized protein [Prorops nasuta]|uniref:uncharacterized protein n=1 Tax=Prorops nasuta TaxID=863751 RepID=UPI0034CF782A